MSLQDEMEGLDLEGKTVEEITDLLEELYCERSYPGFASIHSCSTQEEFLLLENPFGGFQLWFALIELKFSPFL